MIRVIRGTVTHSGAAYAEGDIFSAAEKDEQRLIRVGAAEAVRIPEGTAEAGATEPAEPKKKAPPRKKAQ